MSGQSLPPKGVEVLPPSEVEEANAARVAADEEAAALAREQLDAEIADLPADQFEALQSRALAQVRSRLGAARKTAQIVRADSPSVRARMRDLHQENQAQARQERAS